MTGRDHPDDRKAGLSPAKRRLLEKRLAARRAGAGPGAPLARQTSGPFPTSFNQERFWLLEQLEPGNPAHNIPYVSRLTGHLDRQAFEAARRAIIRCGSNGYDLPREKYGQWQNIEMTFNPEKMRIK